MTENKQKYAAAVAITCTIASKTSGQGEKSLAVDNSVTLYDDALVHVSVTPGTVTPPGYILVFAYASADDGTTYEGQGSTDSAYNTLSGSEKLIGVIQVPTSSTQATGVFTVAAAFGGVLPRNWGIIIWQSGCGTLNATEGNHIKKFQGITYTNA